MEIRTITGTSISDALEEARSLWGDAVVMLQAQPPSGGERARIAVGIPQDAGLKMAAAALDAQLAVPTAVMPNASSLLNAQATAPVSVAGSASADALTQAALDLITGGPSGGLGLGALDGSDLMSVRGPAGRSSASEILVTPPPGALRRPERGTGALIEKTIRPVADVLTRVNADGTDAAVPAPVPEVLEVQEPRVHEAPDPTRSPLFSHLLRQGVRPKRARQLAEVSISRDVQAAARSLALDLPDAAVGRAPSRVLFAGDPGSGKTSLVLRSALSRVRVGRRAPMIIVVAPDSRNLRGWLDPTPLFESFELEVVRCSREALASALAGIKGEVLVDAPADFRIPAEVDLHVRHVIDARSAESQTDAAVQADSAVVTHLDSTSSLGFLTERLIALQTPVAALVRSGRPEGGIERYDPDAFVELVCHV